MKLSFLVLFVSMVSLSQAPAAIIAEKGAARTVIVVDPNVSITENYAARQLASVLQTITGASFQITTNTESPARAIMVGPGAAAARAFPEFSQMHFGQEELIMRAQGDRILLAGGRPRGTLYAVSRFLQDKCGVRWWTPWASRIPHQSTLQLADMNV